MLLREGRVAFPYLHAEIDQPLSLEHRQRLEKIFQSEPALETTQDKLLNRFLQHTQPITYRQAIYLCAAALPFDRILLEHACGRGGGQVFSPFLSVTTGGPMMNPVDYGVSIEVLIPYPRAFNNWVNDGIEQESLITDLRLEDITRIYFDEDILMDSLLAADSQLVDILPEAIQKHQKWNFNFNRYHHTAITCWRECENERLLPDLWRDEEQTEEAKNHLRVAYRKWGIEGLANNDLEIIRDVSKAFQLF